MLETSARLLRLLALLQTPREWRGTELAARLSVSPRTVRNDIERLRSLGYPVHATRGSSGGYRLEPGADVPPLLLDDDEAVAVAVGLRTAANGGIAGIEETSLRALAKLERVLPSRLRHRLNALTTYTTPVPRDDGGPTVEAGVLTSVVTAARDHETLRFDYRTHDGEPARRITEPHRVVTWGRRWYLLGWDVERRDWRTYRVDRMVPRVPTGPRFTPREIPGGDAAAYVSRGVSSAAWRLHARVVVHAPATVLAERVSPAVGVVEAVDEHTCLLHTGADTVDVLALHLGLLGAPFEVTDPPELVAHVRELARRYAAATPAVPDDVSG